MKKINLLVSTFFFFSASAYAFSEEINLSENEFYKIGIDTLKLKYIVSKDTEIGYEDWLKNNINPITGKISRNLSNPKNLFNKKEHPNIENKNVKYYFKY